MIRRIIYIATTEGTYSRIPLHTKRPPSFHPLKRFFLNPFNPFQPIDNRLLIKNKLSMLPRSLSELLKAEPENSSCQFMLVQRLWTKLLLTTLSGQFGFDRKMIWLSKNNVYFRNLDLYDVEKTVKEVVRQMEANPIISFPAECDFTLLNGFIREVAKGTVIIPFPRFQRQVQSVLFNNVSFKVWTQKTMDQNALDFRISSNFCLLWLF